MKLTLSSISRGSLFWSVYYAWMNENSVFVVASIVNECGDILTVQVVYLVQK